MKTEILERNTEKVEWDPNYLNYCFKKDNDEKYFRGVLEFNCDKYVKELRDAIESKADINYISVLIDNLYQKPTKNQL